MQRFFLSRMLERLFRRWYLYVIPPMLVIAGGLATILQQETPYRSSGVVRVSNQTLLSEITSVRGGSSFGFDTPATYTSREINTLLGTDLFTRSVIETAGLTEAVSSGVLPISELIGAIWATPSGDLLVRINATGENPEVSYRLATATIESYLQWQIDDNVTDSRSAEEFFESLLEPYEERLQNARDELAAYLTENPVLEGNDRPADEQIEIASLSDAVERADNQLATATQSLADARLATAQTSTDIAQRLRIVDAPRLPVAPEPHLRQDAMTLLLCAALGTLISLAALVVSTLADHSVRYSEEVERTFGVPVVATVPESRSAIPPSTL